MGNTYSYNHRRGNYVSNAISNENANAPKVKPPSVNKVYKVKNSNTGECLVNWGHYSHNTTTLPCDWYGDYSNMQWRFNSLNNNNKDFYLKNEGTNLCFFNNGDGRIGSYNCNTEWNDQLWNLKDTGNSNYLLHNANSNKCTSSAANNNRWWGWGWNDDDEDSWWGGWWGGWGWGWGWYNDDRWLSDSAYDNKYDVDGGASQVDDYWNRWWYNWWYDDSKIKTRYCGSDINNITNKRKLWNLVDVTPTPPAPPSSNNFFQLKNTANQCIYNSDSNTTNITACNNDINQIWQFNPKNDGNNGFQLKNMNTNRCLYNNADGRLGSFDCNNNNEDQTWNLKDEYIANGYFKLLNKNSDNCLIGNNDILDKGYCRELNQDFKQGQLWNLNDNTPVYQEALRIYNEALNKARKAATDSSQAVIDINACKTQIDAILTSIRDTVAKSQKSTDIAAIEKANIANNNVRTKFTNVSTEVRNVDSEAANVTAVSSIPSTQVSNISNLKLADAATATSYATAAAAAVDTAQAAVARARAAVTRAREESKAAAKFAALAVLEQANQDSLRAQNAATRARTAAKDAQDAATDAENNAKEAVLESKLLYVKSATEHAQVATESAGKSRKAANIAVAASVAGTAAANSSSAAAAVALTRQGQTENTQTEPLAIAALATVVASANTASSFLPIALTKLNESMSSSNTALRQSQLAISSAKKSEAEQLAAIKALEKRSNEVIKVQNKIISNIQTGISISSIISSSNTTPTQTSQIQTSQIQTPQTPQTPQTSQTQPSQTVSTTPQSRSNFANINENNSIMFSPNGNPEINNYINSYNKSIALQEDPNQMSKVAFDTYMHIQNKKLKELNANLDDLNKNTTKMVYPIKAIKSMSNSKMLNVEAYPDPTNANNVNSNSNSGNGSKTYPNYLIYGNNGCLQYTPDSNFKNKSSSPSPSPTENRPASWTFKSCDSNNPNQQFSVNQITNISQYNAPITNKNNARHILNDPSSTQFGFYTVNPNIQADQCLQLNNDGISIMPCNMDNSQKFKPSYHPIME